MRSLLSIALTLTMIPICAQENSNDLLTRARKQENLGNYDKAIALYKNAINLQPTNGNIRLECARLQARLGNYKQAITLYDNILQLYPHNPDILCNKGIVLKKMHRYQEAIQVYKESLRVKPNDPRAYRGVSHAYLALGDFKNGWPAYEYRWVRPPAYVQHCKDYLQTHHSLYGKTILLKAEYGLGDTMQFIRYARLIKNRGATVIVESQRPLVKLLSLCPYIDRVIPAGSPLPSTDFTCLIMSLPLIFGTTLATIPHEMPYLYAHRGLVAQWKQTLNTTDFKIGICWQADVHKDSNNKTVQDDSAKKSTPLALLTSLAQLPGIRLYSLQKIDGIEQLDGISPDTLHLFDADFDKSNGAFMDTAAIMQHLDLVITIDTSVAHLAGGLGVPVWVLLPYNADWRWLLDCNDSPWYPTMKLIKQPRAGDWETVINTVRTLLKKRITT